MKIVRRCAVGAGLVLLLAGCATTTRFGALQPTEFRHASFAYRILRNADGQFVSDDWMVDNFYRSGDAWLPREGPNFETALALDLDGNGTMEGAGTVPTYDLLLRNSRDAGTMWARSLPLSKRFDQTELRVLARLYVESVSGAGTIVTAVTRARGSVEVTAESNRFATEVLDERPWAVGGYEAYLITFQVANVDQLSLSENSLWERAVVAIVRPGFLWTNGTNNAVLFPTVLMLGYSNLPEDFEEHLPDFYKFVESVDWYPTELAEARQVVLDCTTEDMVRVIATAGTRTVRNRTGSIVVSPDVTEAELECLRTRVPLVGVSFSARRTPYEVPPAGATTTTPPTEVPTTPQVETPTIPPVEAPVTVPVENLVAPPVQSPVTPPVEAPAATVQPPVTTPDETPAVAPTETPAASPAASP
jgi:hypothetical protein